MDDSLGARAHKAIVESMHVEETGWAPDLLRRAHARIARELRAAAALTPVVLWSTRPIAFTLPGQHVYVSRELLSRGMAEPAAAFLLAHEVAHHELGHLAPLERWITRLGASGLGLPAAVLIAHLARVHRARADEIAADRLAFETCRVVGYPDSAGEQLFALLERIFLDYRAVDGVLGGAHAPGPHPPLRWRRDAVRRWSSEAKGAIATFGEFVRRRSGRDI